MSAYRELHVPADDVPMADRIADCVALGAKRVAINPIEFRAMVDEWDARIEVDPIVGVPRIIIRTPYGVCFVLPDPDCPRDHAQPVEAT